MDDMKEKLESWIAEEAKPLGLDAIALRYEVRRELTMRAAQRIATKVEKQVEEAGRDAGFVSW
jgi:hypothetical protein